jgi:hypothetical protein
VVRISDNQVEDTLIPTETLAKTVRMTTFDVLSMTQFELFGRTRWELLSVFLIPLTLAALPLIWAFTTSRIRRFQLRKLVLRELEEVGPYPKDKREDKKCWEEHHTKKRFMHTELLKKPTENRDVILSLPSDLVYHVNQLWNSKRDAEQWLEMLSKIEGDVPFWQSRRKREIKRVKREWCRLMREYEAIPESSSCEDQKRRESN